MKPCFVKICILLLVIFWVAVHIPGVLYGTWQLPLHQSYVGDEQSPINGAFHMLEEKSPLGLRNVWTVYYGPVFSVVAVPAVLFDAGLKYFESKVHTAEDYKQSILFDWGTIDAAARGIAVIFATIFLFTVYYFLKEEDRGVFSSAALVAVLLVAIDYHFFEYSNFFKHWIFALATLGFQWLSLKKILAGGGTRWWFLHGAATVFAAGISYVSLGQLIMWLPVLISWVRRREWRKFISFARLVYSVAILMLVIILWHPIILFRYLSMVGVGENVANSYGLQDPTALSGGSIVYYGTLIGLNLLPLLIAAIIMIVSLWREKIYSRVMVWIIVLPGLFYLLLFGPAAHHEGRYMLPTIICIIVLAGYLLIEWRNKPRSKTATTVVYSLLALYVLLHGINVLKWINVYSKGPAEQVMISNVLAKAREGKPKILLVQNYIAGHLHTNDAYRRYAKDFKKDGFDLYREILKAPVPKGIQPLDATYILHKDYFVNTDIGNNYDQVVIQNVPRDDINQFDFVDEKISRIWMFDKYVPSYTYVK